MIYEDIHTEVTLYCLYLKVGGSRAKNKWKKQTFSLSKVFFPHFLMSQVFQESIYHLNIK